MKRYTIEIKARVTAESPFDAARRAMQRPLNELGAVFQVTDATNGSVWNINLDAPKPATQESLLKEALDYQAAAFFNGEDINGAEALDWFAQWRQRVAALLLSEKTLLT